MQSKGWALLRFIVKTVKWEQVAHVSYMVLRCWGIGRGQGHSQADVTGDWGAGMWAWLWWWSLDWLGEQGSDLACGRDWLRALGDRSLQEIAEPEPEDSWLGLDIHVLIHWWSNMNWWFRVRPSLKFWGSVLNRHRHLLEWSWHSEGEMVLQRRGSGAQVFSEGWRGSWERVVVLFYYFKNLIIADL